MPCLCYMRNWIHAFVQDYESLKNLADILIYIQIGCSSIGSVDGLYNYVSLINLGIELVGSRAITRNTQSLTRTYAVMLFCAIPLDIFWLWYHIRSMSAELENEMVGFCVRFFSYLVWIQMYRLERFSHVDGTTDASLQDPNSYSRRRFLNRASQDTSSRSNDDSDDTNFFEDDDQQHNVNSPLVFLSKQLENELQRLELRKAQLLELIDKLKLDLEKQKALSFQLKALKLQIENAKKVPKNSSN